MIYNVDDWTPGDLAWVTANDRDPRLRDKPHHHGRQLRMLARRRSSGTSTSTTRTSRWNAGALHWINADGAWILATAPGLILNIERAVVVDPEALDAENRNHSAMEPLTARITWETA